MAQRGRARSTTTYPTTDFRLVAYAAAAGLGPDAVVYQIFPDRFARSAAADAPARCRTGRSPCDWDTPVDRPRAGDAEQFYGGDLDGIAEHLDHLTGSASTPST